MGWRRPTWGGGLGGGIIGCGSGGQLGSNGSDLLGCVNGGSDRFGSGGDDRLGCDGGDGLGLGCGDDGGLRVGGRGRLSEDRLGNGVNSSGFENDGWIVGNRVAARKGSGLALLARTIFDKDYPADRQTCNAELSSRENMLRAHACEERVQ